jgi:hypothetical protein
LCFEFPFFSFIAWEGIQQEHNNAIPLQKAIKGNFAERPKNSCCNIISIANAGASGRLGLLQVEG